MYNSQHVNNNVYIEAVQAECMFDVFAERDLCSNSELAGSNYYFAAAVHLLHTEHAP